MDAKSPITIDPDIQGGAPCFTGTRVPVRSLFDYVARGRSLDYFLEQFPTVSRQAALDVLKKAGESLYAAPAEAAHA